MFKKKLRYILLFTILFMVLLLCSFAPSSDKTVEPLVLSLERTLLKNVDDAVGQWQHSGGKANRNGQHVANYISVKRVTPDATPQQNTATLTITLFFIGEKPPQSITLQGTHDFSSGGQAGSVSAASSDYAEYIGGSFTTENRTIRISTAYRINKANKEPLSAKVTVSAEDKSITVYSGTVIDLDGNAIEGAKLHIFSHYGIKTVSGQQGGYQMSLDISEVYESHRDIYIIARHEEKNLASATRVGTETQTRNITLLPAVTANGTITDPDGNPIENGTVSFCFTAAKGYIDSFADRRRFEADSRGIYKVPFIPPKNRYLVRFHAEGYGSREISVNTNEAVDGVLELGAAALSKANQTISGVVVDPDGNPVPNVQIFLKSTGQPSGYIETDADGRFTIAVCKGDVVLSAVVKKGNTMLVGRAKAASGTEDVKIVLEPR